MTPRRPGTDLDDDGRVVPPDPARISAIIRRLREEANLTQADLARRIQVPQAYVSRWELNRVPRPDDLYRIEVDGFRLPPGAILAEAGFVQNSRRTEDVIMGDPLLRERERIMLRAAYLAVAAV